MRPYVAFGRHRHRWGFALRVGFSLPGRDPGRILGHIAASDYSPRRYHWLEVAAF